MIGAGPAGLKAAEVLAGRGLPRSSASRSFELLHGVLPAELVHASSAARGGVGALSI